jgi:hypothetical protein
VLEGTEWRKLLKSIPATTLRDLRDRALIATLTYSFARINDISPCTPHREAATPPPVTKGCDLFALRSDQVGKGAASGRSGTRSPMQLSSVPRA